MVKTTKQEDKAQVLQGILYNLKGAGTGEWGRGSLIPGSVPRGTPHFLTWWEAGRMHWRKLMPQPLPNASHLVTQENSCISIWAEAPACSRKMRKTTLVQEKLTGAPPLPSKRVGGEKNLFPSGTPKCRTPGCANSRSTLSL